MILFREVLGRSLRSFILYASKDIENSPFGVWSTQPVQQSLLLNERNRGEVVLNFSGVDELLCALNDTVWFG